jgi:hypothetical protein
LISLSAFDRTPLKNLFLNENIQDVKEQNCNQLIIPAKQRHHSGASSAT